MVYGSKMWTIATFLLALTRDVHGSSSSILSQFFADLKQGYGGHLSNLHAEFNKRTPEADDRITVLEKKYVELQAKCEALLEEKRDPKRDARLIPPPQPKQNISFYAQLTSNVNNMGNFQAIIFDMVTTNNGNAYNKADGIFTVPTSGTYVFSWTSANDDHSHMQTEIVANGISMGKTWSDSYDHADRTIASNTVVLNLVEGDTVWIRSGSVHSGSIRGDQMSTFSGWFLH